MVVHRSEWMSFKRQFTNDHVSMVLKAHPTSMTGGTSVLAALILKHDWQHLT